MYLEKSRGCGARIGVALCRLWTPHAPAHRAVSRDALLRHHHHSHIHIYREVGMVMIGFVGGATFDEWGKGATSILQAVI
jgi:hypothetical protein